MISLNKDEAEELIEKIRSNAKNEFHNGNLTYAEMVEKTINDCIEHPFPESQMLLAEEFAIRLDDGRAVSEIALKLYNNKSYGKNEVTLCLQWSALKSLAVRFTYEQFVAFIERCQKIKEWLDAEENN